MSASDTLPSPGAKAPAFRLEAVPGGPTALKDFLGRWLVLYFYPKDDTPGCTVEACAFGESHAALRKAGAEVVGISPDGAESHARFAGKFSLPFPLLSDPDHAVASAYGVWVKKNMYGRESMGIQRSTFLIDPKGVVARVWAKVRPEGHAAEVLAALREEKERA